MSADEKLRAASDANEPPAGQGVLERTTGFEPATLTLAR